MHVCHILLVVADNQHLAFEEVQSKLGSDPAWSDWNNVGAEPLNFAGRWSGSIFGSVDEEGNIKNQDTNPNFLRYADDPALAEQVLTSQINQRMHEIANYQEKAIDLSSFSYDPYGDDFNMDLWATKKLAQILDDEWTPDTYVYDLEEWTGNLRHFTKRVATDPLRQYLIPVDFHF